MKELGVDETKLEPCKFPGGETEGLRRLNEKISIANGSWVRSFEKPQTSPNSLEPSTTVLSPYLKFGCVSCRELYYKLLEVNSKGQENSESIYLSVHKISQYTNENISALPSINGSNEKIMALYYIKKPLISALFFWFNPFYLF